MPRGMVPSTYQTKAVKLLDMLDTRSRGSTKDAYIQNGHVEIYKDQNIGSGDYEIVKREGLSAYTYVSASTNTRGVYYWEEQGKIFVAKDSYIDIITASTGVLITTITPFGTTTGDVGFTEYIYDTGIVVLMVTDGTTLIKIATDNTYTTVGTSRSIDATWTANTAYTQGQIIAPTVANGYYNVVAVGGTSGSTEPVWNLTEGDTETDGSVTYTVISSTNALPVPHLPYPLFLDGYLLLAKAGTADLYNSDLNDPTAFTASNFISAEMVPDSLVRIAKMNNYILAFGTASIEYFWDAANETGSPLQRNDTPVKFIGYLGGFAQMGNNIFFLGIPPEGSPTLYTLQDFKITSIAGLAVKKWVKSLQGDHAVILSHSGKDFYVYASAGTSYAVDVDTGMWNTISFQQRADFPITHTVSAAITNFGNTNICFFSTTGATYFVDRTATIDAGTSFPFVIQTDLTTFDTNKWKFMSKVSVVGDQTSSTSPLLVQWTDDDYQTYNTARSVDMGTQNPVLFRCGRFRKRGFKLTYSDSFPMRLKALEIEYNQGER